MFGAAEVDLTMTRCSVLQVNGAPPQLADVAPPAAVGDASDEEVT